MRSMTAYGRGQLQTAKGKWIIEIHSVNRKSLDINVILPKELLALDLEVRKAVKEEVHRGQVTVRAVWDGEMMLAPLLGLKQKWEKVARALGFDPKEAVDFRFLLEQMEEVDTPSLKKAVGEALKPFLAMKRKEGNALAKEMGKQLRGMRTVLKEVERLAPKAREAYEKKLRGRIQGMADEEKIVREVVLFAEKVDVSEEVSRLYSHMAQFEEVAHSGEKSVGRTLDFLMQEMGREIHTLTAKAGDDKISRLAVIIKGEIEKIREQVQNIE